ncbi:MAG: phosphoribosyltransferase [Rhabdochlamydiaceae bacterium]|nr:phosphoribosyltransferase [Rhabdochlamydiaceae bacterium]
MFKDREDAGIKLAAYLEKYKRRKDCIVLGLARGGVVVAAAVAKALELPLSVATPRKLGAPGNPELAIGAVMETGEPYLNEPLIQALGVSIKYINSEIERERKRSAERSQLFTKKKPLLKDKTVLLIDDGIATGATMYASIESVKKQQASAIVVAVPTGPSSTIEILQEQVDEVVCLETLDLGSVSCAYEDFSEVHDKDVIALLA